MKKFNKTLRPLDRDPSSCYMLDTLPKDIDKEIDSLLKPLIKSNFKKGFKINHSLAGQINNEYALEPSPKLYDYIFDGCNTYLTKYPILIERERRKFLPHQPEFVPDITMETLWVNFQKKHEYNPPHSHSGLVSFVIWYKIPYLFKDEATKGPGKYADGVRTVNTKKDNYEENFNGTFSFLHPDVSFQPYLTGQIIPIDKTFEKTICFFPSHLYHSVNPFYTSDDYRISLSANIFFVNQFKHHATDNRN